MSKAHTVELIFRAVDAASADVAKLRKELEELQKLQLKTRQSGRSLPSPQQAPNSTAKRELQELIRLSKELDLSFEEAQAAIQAIGLDAGRTRESITLLNQLQSVGADNTAIFQALQDELGVTETQFESLNQVLEELASLRLSKQTPAIPPPPIDEFERVVGFAQQLNVEFDEAKKIIDDIGIDPDTIVQAKVRFQQLKAVGIETDEAIERITQELGLTSAQLQKVVKIGTNDGGRLQKAFFGVGSAIQAVGQNFLGVQAAIQTAIGVGQQFYSLFIGSNERLNQELLKSQANLAATTKILVDGVEVTDPLQKVRATREQLNDALRQLEVEVVDLVGLTSSDIGGIFQTVLGNAGAISTQLQSATGEGQKFSNAIEAAIPLTKNFAAAAGVLLNGDVSMIPQEVRSILQGDVGPDSTIARALNLSGPEIKRLQAQGTLVDTLIQKLEPFAAANAEAARSVSGLSSNILDIFQIVNREVGKPLLEPIIGSLSVVEQTLRENKEALIEFFGSFGNVLAGVFESVKNAIAPVVERYLEIAKGAGPEIQAAFGQIGILLKSIVNLLGEVFQAYADFYEVDDAENLANSIGDVSEKLAKVIDLIDGKSIGKFFQISLLPIELLLKGMEAVDVAIQKSQELLGRAEGLVNRIPGVKLDLDGSDASVAAAAVGAGLDAVGESAQGAVGEIGLAAQGLQEIGNTQEALATQALGLRNRIFGPDNVGPQVQTIQELDSATKEYIGTLDQQLQRGEISKESVIAELEAIRDSTTQSIESRQAAAEQIEKIEKQFNQNELQGIKNQQSEVETLLAERRITEEEAARRSTELKRAELDEQIKDVEEQQARLREQGVSEDSAQFQELVQQRKELQLQLRQVDADAFNEQQKLRDQANKLELEAIKRNQQEIEVLVQQGELGIVEAAQRTTEARKKELDEQLKDVQEQKQALIKAGANQGSNEFKELIEQEKQLQLQRQELVIEGEKTIQEARLKELQFAQDKALDEVKAAETARLIELEQLLIAEPRQRQQIELEKLQLTRDRIEEELALEQERIAFLESQRDTGSVEDQLQREDEIRSAKQKTADLTLELIRNEGEQQENLREKLIRDLEKQQQAIDNATQAEKNRTDAAVQGLESESALLDALNRTYERQIGLLQEESNLRGAINGFYQSQKGLLAQINQELGKDKQAAKIREEAAEMAVVQLREQQRIEDIILEQQIRQNEILLEQEIIQNRINQARAAAEAKQAEADFQKAQIELQKVVADPNASQGDIEAASLSVDAAAIGVTAAREAIRGFQVEAGFLQDRRAMLDDQARSQRQAQDIQQRQTLNQTRFDAAMAQDTESERRSDLRSLRGSIQSDLGNERYTQPTFRAPRRVDEQRVQQEFDQIGATLGIQPATEIPTAMGGMESLATETAKQTGILTAINDGIAKLQGLVPELNVTFNNSYGAGQERQAANDAEQMIVQSVRELRAQIS